MDGKERRLVVVRQAAMSSARTSSLFSLFAAIGLVAVVLFLTSGLVNGAMPGICFLTARIKDIAEGKGDLTERIEIKSNHELGEIGSWFNAFAEKLHGVISQVADTSGSLAGATTEQLIATAATEQTAASDEIGDSAKAIATLSLENNRGAEESSNACKSLAQLDSR